MLHMRVARHADRLEVNKVESWWCSGENWREKKRAKVHKTSHKSVGSRPVIFYCPWICWARLFEGKTRRLVAFWLKDITVIQWNFLRKVAANRLRGTRSASWGSEVLCWWKCLAQEGQNPPTSAKDLPGPEERNCADGWNTRWVSNSLKSALNPPDIAVWNEIFYILPGFKSGLGKGWIPHWQSGSMVVNNYNGPLPQNWQELSALALHHHVRENASPADVRFLLWKRWYWQPDTRL